MPEGYDSAQLPDHISRTTYARIELPKLLPANMARVIYLDGDILVMNDLANLWETEFGGHVLLAVRDYRIPTVSSEAGGLARTWSQLGIDPGAPYFNAGVLVINLDYWRQNRVGEAISDYLNQYGKTTIHCDQDVLNAVTVNHWGALDIRWNVPVLFLRHTELICASIRTEIEPDVAAFRRLAYIAHFVSSQKPWNDLVREPLAWKWRWYLNRSGWFSAWDLVTEQTQWFVKATWRMARRRLARAAS